MTYAVLLSQEHPDLPRAEAEAAFRAEDIDAAVDEQLANLLLVDAPAIGAVPDRLAMAFEVAEVLHRFPPDAYQKLAARDVTADDSFAVRTVVLDDTDAPDELEANVGRIIDSNSDAGVDLDEPDEVFRVYLVDGEAVLCRLVQEIDRSDFEARTNQERPYSAPVTIHPRLARALVNLSEVSRDGAVLDPFCGTGGILIEAGLIGCEVYGLDMQREMVDGTETNLASFRLKGRVRQGAFAEIDDVFDRTFDAVVTDLPYGKASKQEGDPAAAFVERVSDLTDGAAVFVSDRDDLGGLDPRFELFVHRSLTRYIYVMD